MRFMKNHMVDVTRKDYEDLARLLQEHKDKPNNFVFQWKGRDLLKSYATYLLEYLKGQFDAAD